MRVETTVVETKIHSPINSGLLADGISCLLAQALPCARMSPDEARCSYGNCGRSIRESYRDNPHSQVNFSSADGFLPADVIARVARGVDLLLMRNFLVDSQK